jgi:hypothetical protein
MSDAQASESFLGILDGHPQAPGLVAHSLQPVEKIDLYDISTMDEVDLLKLRDEIEQKLQGLTLADVNLVKETMIQLKKAKLLQIEATKKDSETPMNQRAQVQNSIASILDKLGKMQTELYDSEKLKRLQAAVVKVVKQLPKESQVQFFEMLEMEFAVAEAEVNA